MAFEHGRKAIVQLDDSAGSLTDITAFCDTWAMPRSIDTAETSVFNITAKTYVLGMEDATISTGGPFDPTIDAHFDALIAALLAGTIATASFQFDPQGSTTGLPRYTGESLVTAYEANDGIGDAGRWTAELQITAGVTRATVP